MKIGFIPDFMWILYCTDMECVSINLVEGFPAMLISVFKNDVITGDIKEKFVMECDKFLAAYEYIQNELQSQTGNPRVSFISNEVSLLWLEAKYKKRLSDIFEKVRDAILIRKL